MIRVHDFERSGNAHKVRNLLSLLAVPHELIPVDLAGGEQGSPAFRALNPFGHVPVLVDGDVVIRDSSAILVYLARKFGRGEWLPVDAEGEARVQEWLAVATHEVADSVAYARLITVFGARGELEAKQGEAHGLLRQFESHLGDHAYLAGDRVTIADIANHSYLALASEGGVELDAYPAIRNWIERLEKLPGFVPVPMASAAGD